MKFPEVITVKILNNSQKVCGLICSVDVLTYHKNNYPMGIYKTNDEGIFVITKEIITGKIQESNELFIMDYDNSLRNFTGNIEITIESLEDINRMIRNVEKFFPEKAIEMKSISEKNINHIIDISFLDTFQIKENIEYDISGSQGLLGASSWCPQTK